MSSKVHSEDVPPERNVDIVEQQIYDLFGHDKVKTASLLRQHVSNTKLKRTPAAPRKRQHLNDNNAAAITKATLEDAVSARVQNILSFELNNIDNNKLNMGERAAAARGTVKLHEDTHNTDLFTLPKNMEKWPGKVHSKELLPDFFRRVWGSYLKQGLALSHLRTGDRKLYNAIFSWRNYECQPWPSDLIIPTQPMIVALSLQRLRSGQDLSSKELERVARKLARDAKKNNL